MQFIKGLIVKAILSSSGYKTYAAAIGAILAGIGLLLAGEMEFQPAMDRILAGLAVFGLGHKLQKFLDLVKDVEGN